MTQIRVLILTGRRRGIASRCLPELCNSDNIIVSQVILSSGTAPDKKKQRRRKLLKILKIGILGALNGIRMRPWYEEDQEPDIEQLCKKSGIPFAETAAINSDQTRQLFRQSEADLGLSLGNGFIAESVFSIPKFGMVNIHCERLPEYQNAQSIIWPVYNNEVSTGLTVHQVDKKIDTGNILHQETYPIEFHVSLEQTVRHNVKRTYEKVPGAMRHVCENYVSLQATAEPQGHGSSYTTPSIWQFMRMARNNHQLYKKTRANNP